MEAGFVVRIVLESGLHANMQIGSTSKAITVQQSRNIDMKNATKAELFEKAYKGLEEQGFKLSGIRYEIDGSTECQYRYGDLKCAAGHIFSDEELRTFGCHEGYVADILAVRLGYSEDAATFIRKLQKAHDQSDSPEDMKANLLAIKSEEKL